MPVAAARVEATLRPAPDIRVRTVMRDLDIPWDVTFLPSGAMLVTERDRERILVKTARGKRRVVAAALPGVWSFGETGLMGIVADPRFRQNRRFYTCHGYQDATTTDVRVAAWRIDKGLRDAWRVETLVTGIPAATDGRHGGCRLRFGPGGALYVSTGDAAYYRNAQNLRSLGGKVLRVDPGTGKALRGNPYYRSDFVNKRKLWTHGHRNVQGLALRPRTQQRGRQLWSVEHGPACDDEVNLLVRGADYGWDPEPYYDESVPMTDFSLPGRQRGARWSSGCPTVATSGAGWLAGKRWGTWRGRLAVAALKDSSLRLLRFDRSGDLLGGRLVSELDGTYGRLRTAQLGPRKVLYVTTSNGGGNDRVLAVVARRR